MKLIKLNTKPGTLLVALYLFGSIAITLFVATFSAGVNLYENRTNIEYVVDYSMVTNLIIRFSFFILFLIFGRNLVKNETTGW